MAQDVYDVIVVGGGPGGYIAAIKAAQLGLSVACVEKRETLGGTCLNVGCIPSKALLNATHKFADIAHLKEWGVTVKELTLDVPTLMRKKNEVVLSLTQGIDFLFKKNKITRLLGSATVVSACEVDVGEKRLNATKGIIIATGSTNVDIAGIPIDESVIVSSTGALSWERAPGKLAVIGGGYIGLEMASVWARLGSEVTVIEFQERPVAMMDDDLSSGLKTSLEKQGLTFLLGTRVTGVERTKTGAKVHVDGPSGPKTLEVDAVLVSVGRKPYTEGLGLDTVGVAKNEKGFIIVDDRLQTSVAGIYAIGDVTPGPMLAHRSEEEGVAVAEILAGQKPIVDHHLMPGVVYTSPEAATVGLTERQLKEQGVAYNVGKFSFAANSRAKASGSCEGFVKILADKATDKILGVHILGTDAGTLIGECVVAMAYQASSEDLARIISAHPTTNEAVKEAALATFFKALHA